MQDTAANEICANCGNFVTHLVDETGWCYSCSGDTDTQCLACGEEFTKDQTHRKLCPRCREERWLAIHAEELEELLSYGSHISFAKREVYRRNRPTCVSCKEPIKGATNGAMFCTRTVECRRWRRRYRTLRERYNDGKLAASQVSAEIFATEHRMEIDIEG